MNKEYITRKIFDMLEDKFSLHTERNEKTTNTLLTKAPFSLTSLQLYELLMCIENEFHVYILPKSIKEHGFHTVAEISRLLERPEERKSFNCIVNH